MSILLKIIVAINLQLARQEHDKAECRHHGRVGDGILCSLLAVVEQIEQKQKAEHGNEQVSHVQNDCRHS